ncbi:MAG: HupE/UreJ family protein [Algicola sp.]|nr:HupE/UreJ family protein [Algicola sp.]
MKSALPNLWLTRAVWILLSFWMTIQSAFAHQAGVIDSHIKVGHSTVALMFTVPADKLKQRFGQDDEQFDPTSVVEKISNSFEVFNGKQSCRVIDATTRPLSTINSQQYFITYGCTDKLSDVYITDNNSLSWNDNYKNFTRFSIAGRSKKVVFESKTPTHKFVVATLLTLWNSPLTEEVTALSMAQSAKNNTEATQPLTYETFMQSSNYLPIGFEHILFGWDHVLFLMGLLLLVTQVKPLLIQVTFFTLAHCMALALSVLNIVNLSIFVVEALIALTIVYVAVENIFKLHKIRIQGSAKSKQPNDRHRWLLIIVFGFIHGFGFSFLLKEMGHTDDLLPSLVFFNIGVELGQLTIVLPLFLLLSWADRQFRSSPAQGVLLFKQVISFITGVMGGYWFIERTFM